MISVLNWNRDLINHTLDSIDKVSMIPCDNKYTGHNEKVVHVKYKYSRYDSDYFILSKNEWLKRHVCDYAYTIKTKNGYAVAMKIYETDVNKYYWLTHDKYMLYNSYRVRNRLDGLESSYDKFKESLNG